MYVSIPRLEHCPNIASNLIWCLKQEEVQDNFGEEANLGAEDGEGPTDIAQKDDYDNF